MAKAKRKGRAVRVQAKRDLAPPGVDWGPVEPLARGERVKERASAREGVRRVRTVCECRLDWYQNRCLIDDRQHEAGLRFRTAVRLAQLQPRVTALYGGTVAGDASNHGQWLDAMKAVRQAVAALPPECRQVTVAVCALDQWASGALPQLRLALDRLADWYRIPRADAGLPGRAA